MVTPRISCIELYSFVGYRTSSQTSPPFTTTLQLSAFSMASVDASRLSLAERKIDDLMRKLRMVKARLLEPPSPDQLRKIHVSMQYYRTLASLGNPDVDRRHA